MPSFIKLTDLDGGEPLWVNFAQVINFFDAQGKYTVVTQSDGDTLRVRETPDYILNQLASGVR